MCDDAAHFVGQLAMLPLRVEEAARLLGISKRDCS